MLVILYNEHKAQEGIMYSSQIDDIELIKTLKECTTHTTVNSCHKQAIKNYFGTRSCALKMYTTEHWCVYFIEVIYEHF